MVNDTVVTAVVLVAIVVSIISTTGVSLDKSGKCKAPTIAGHTTRGSAMVLPGPTIAGNMEKSPYLVNVAVIVLSTTTATDRATIPPGLMGPDVVPNSRAIDAIDDINRGRVEMAT